MGVFDLTWITATLRLSTPLICASTGEVVSERAGILNIGLEGMMLSGAFFGYFVTDLTGSFVIGTAAAVAGGMLSAAIVALLAIHTRADQIVVGIGLNILMLGVTSLLFRHFYSSTGETNLLERPKAWAIPGLSELPVLGEMLFRHPPWIYFALILVPLVWIFLFRTTVGLSIRAAGELPEAADTGGADVQAIRWMGVLVAGAMAGFGGSFLSIELGVFIEGMTDGRGFLALAAVILGRWHPAGVLGACLLFGGADALQLRLQAEPFVPWEVWLMIALLGPVYLLWRWSRGRVPAQAILVASGALSAVALVILLSGAELSLPPQLWRILPFVLTLLVLGGVIGRARMPSALAIPYKRGEL